MSRNPVAKLDPDTCVDFSIQSGHVSDKYRENYDAIFRKKIRHEPCDEFCIDYPNCRCGEEL